MTDVIVLDRGKAPPIPFGWYGVAYSDELAVGDVRPLHFFGVDFVIWRGEDNKVRATEAYCKHLGAHLGYGGKVQQNDLVCPFHAWRYDGGGKVVEIPYAKMVPPQLKRDCLYSYPVAELNRLIHVWYHPRRVAPLWEPAVIEDLDTADWAPFEKMEWIIDTHIRDLAENSVDFPHFFYVHRVAELPPRGEITEAGPRRETLAKVEFVTPRGPVSGTIRSGQIGPGQGYSRFAGIANTLVVTSVVPISATRTWFRFAFTQPVGVAGSNVGNALIKEIVKQLNQDIPIWNHKRLDNDPFIVNGDGPIKQFREYFSQFYADEPG